MKTLLILAALLLAPLAGLHAADVARPNLLFIIADDASRHFGEAYGCKWVKTPAIDRLAKNGLVFANAYTPTGKCAPSRSAILTGRNPWQLEDAANHQPYFPAKFMAFSEALRAGGIHVGGEGKIWGPGTAETADGKARSFGFGAGGASRRWKDFSTFLKARPSGQPFFYWFGSNYPHRKYDTGSGLAAGKKLSDIDRVPGFWPDNDTVRSDMLDYAMEVEAFDAQVGELVKALEASGEAANTLVIVTSDNGMPFPRSKGHNYDISNREPMVASWPGGIAKPGSRITDFVSFIDFAPTFLELLGVDGAKAGMSPITGRSFTGLLRGKADAARSFVILGRERNDVLARPGTPAGLGYPVRAIRDGDFLYIHNFEPGRWPCGNPDAFADTDGSPTKSWIEALGDKNPFWQMAFGKRPANELFDLAKDPDCLTNLAAEPAHAAKGSALRDKLMAELKRQNDPRVLGRGEVFDQYESPYAKRKPANRKAKKGAAEKEEQGAAKKAEFSINHGPASEYTLPVETGSVHVE